MQAPWVEAGPECGEPLEHAHWLASLNRQEHEVLRPLSLRTAPSPRQAAMKTPLLALDFRLGNSSTIGIVSQSPHTVVRNTIIPNLFVYEEEDYDTTYLNRMYNRSNHR